MNRNFWLVWVVVGVMVTGFSCGGSKGKVLDEDGANDDDTSIVTGFEIKSFGATPSWGMAPFSTELKWVIEKDSDKILICTLDVDGDGNVDHTFNPCPDEGGQAYEYIEAGRYNPVLKVMDSAGNSIGQTTELFSNMIEYYPHTRFTDKENGFLSSDVTDSAVTLNFSDSSKLPDYKAGDVLMGMDGYGYLRKVVSVTKSGNRLIIETEQAKLEEAIKNAKFGVKDEPLMIRSAECVENCENAQITNLNLAKKGSESGKIEFFTTEYEIKLFEEKWDAESGKNKVEIKGNASAKAKAGLKVSYYIDIEVDILNLKADLKEFSLDLKSFAELGLFFKIQGKFTHSTLAPRLFIGTVPIGPIIITFGFTPEVEFSISAAIAAELKLKLETGALMKYENGKFSSLISGDLAPSVDLTDKGGLALEAEAKVGIMPQFDARIFDVAGPVIAPEPYFKIKGKHELGSEEVCATGKIGADLWLKGVLDLFVVKFETKTSFHLIEWEFWKDCWDFSENNDNDTIGDIDEDVPDEDISDNDNELPDDDTDIKDCTPGQVQTIICATDSTKLQKQVCDANGYWQNDGACYERPDSGILCTNQTKCYDNSSEMTCPAPGEDFYGQDAQYSLLLGCTALSYTVSGTAPEEIVTDNNTGLKWQRTLSGSTYTWQNAINYCNNLTYGGYSDWRLPTIEELETLVDYGRASPAIDIDAFPGTPSSWFWSSSSGVSYTSSAWSVNFSHGSVGSYSKTDDDLARCAR